MKPSFTHSINRALYPSALTLLLLSALFCGLMQWLTPYQMDDLAYGEHYKAAMQGAAPGASWSDGVEFIKWHWQEINGRLGDKLMLWVLTDIPKWFFGCIAGLASLCIFLFGSRVAFGSVRARPLCSIMLTGMFTVFLPWAGYMFVTNMFLNYGLGSAFAIIVLWLFVRTPRLPAPKWLIYPALFLLATIASGWHEAYSVPMLPAMCVFMLIMRRQNPAVRWWLLAGTFAGLLLILSDPGFWHRLDSSNPFLICWEGYKIPGILKGLNILILLPLLLLLALRRRTIITRSSIALFSMGLTIIAGALVIYFNSMYVLRVFWYADVLVFPILALFGAELCSPMKASLKQTVVLLTTIGMVIHYMVCISWQQMLTREHGEIVEAYERSADGVVFHDFHGRYFGPLPALRKARIFAFSYDMRQYLTPYHRSDWAYLSLVPVELRDIESEAFDAPAQMKYYRGYAVSNDSTIDNVNERVQYFRFRSEQGKEMYLPTIVNPFRGKDGKRYFYLEPDERQAGGVKLVSVEKG